jgi:Protein of unknown function (DUF1214)
VSELCHIPPETLARRGADVTLIRPDGYVAYTAHGHGPVAALDAVRTLLERQTVPESDQSPISNPDGSMDVYFGPKAPAGKEPNCVPTSAGGQFEVLFRIYGPERAFFEKTWKLPDIEKIG